MKHYQFFQLLALMFISNSWGPIPNAVCGLVCMVLSVGIAFLELKPRATK